MSSNISQFVGTWKAYEGENVEDFLKEMGVNVVARKAAAYASPTQEIAVDGDKVTIKIDATLKKTNETFTLGLEESRKAEGKNVKTLATYTDGKLIIESTFVDEGGKKVLATREIIGGELVLTWKIKNIEAKRYFKKK